MRKLNLTAINNFKNDSNELRKSSKNPDKFAKKLLIVYLYLAATLANHEEKIGRKTCPSN